MMYPYNLSHLAENTKKLKWISLNLIVKYIYHLHQIWEMLKWSLIIKVDNNKSINRAIYGIYVHDSNIHIRIHIFFQKWYLLINQKNMKYKAHVDAPVLASSCLNIV